MKIPASGEAPWTEPHTIPELRWAATDELIERYVQDVQEQVYYTTDVTLALVQETLRHMAAIERHLDSLS